VFPENVNLSYSQRLLYRHLSEVPLEGIRARFALLKYFNEQLVESINFIDLSSNPYHRVWDLGHKIYELRPIIFLEVKLAFFDVLLSHTKTFSSPTVIHLNRVLATSGKGKQSYSKDL
jgi:hypothetical protein